MRTHELDGFHPRFMPTYLRQGKSRPRSRQATSVFGEVPHWTQHSGPEQVAQIKHALWGTQRIFQIEFHSNLFNGDLCGRCILEITLASTSPNETHFRQPCGNLCHSCPTNGQPSRSKPSSELCGNLPRLPGKRRKMGPGLNICLDMSQSLDHVCF